MTKIKKLRLPNKGEYVRNFGILIDVRTIQPPTPKPYKEYVFEERSAGKELRLKDGTLLKSLGTLTDFYGLGTGEESAIKELKEFAKVSGIDEKSDVEAVVVRHIRQYVAMPKKTPNLFDEIFFDFESKTYLGIMRKDIDVWSSKRGNLLKMGVTPNSYQD